MLSELEKFRDEVILPLAREEMYDVMAIMIAERSDKLLWENRHNPDFVLTPEVMEEIQSKVNSDIRNRIKEMKAESRRDPAIDCEFIITFFEVEDEILAIPRFEKKSFMAALMEFPGVESFCYWNNTDSLPEGVNRRDFNARGALWKKLFKDGNDDLYAPIGLTFTMISEGFRAYASLAELERHMPTIEERFREIQTLEEYQHIESTMTENQRGKISEWLHAAGEWKRSPAGQEIIEKLRQEFQELVANRGWIQKPAPTPAF